MLKGWCALALVLALPAVGQAQWAVTPECAGGFVFDDGTWEDGWSPPSFAVNAAFVVRVDLPPGVDRVDQVCIAWTFLPPEAAAGPPVIAFDLVVFDDDGPGGEPGTELVRVPLQAAVVSSWPVFQFVSHDVAALNIRLPAGSVYLGVGGWEAAAAPGILLAADLTGPSTQPIFQTWDGGQTWTMPTPVLKALGMRADISDPDIFANGFESGTTAAWTLAVP